MDSNQRLAGAVRRCVARRRAAVARSLFHIVVGSCSCALCVTGFRPAIIANDDKMTVRESERRRHSRPTKCAPMGAIERIVSDLADKKTSICITCADSFNGDTKKCDRQWNLTQIDNDSRYSSSAYELCEATTCRLYAVCVVAIRRFTSNHRHKSPPTTRRTTDYYVHVHASALYVDAGDGRRLTDDGDDAGCAKSPSMLPTSERLTVDEPADLSRGDAAAAPNRRRW